MRSQSDDQRRRGYTLTEVVITMLILGILAASAAPRYFDALSRYRAEAAAKRIAADLGFARHRAKASGVNQLVTYTVATDSYVMPAIADPDRPDANYIVQLAQTSYPADMLSVSFGEFGTDNKINFDMYGKPNYGGTIVVAVASHQRTITVNADTGKATITP